MLDLRKEKSDFEVSEVDPISKACQEQLKIEKEIDDLESLMKVKKTCSDKMENKLFL